MSWYTLELDVSTIPKTVIDILMNIGKNNDFDVFRQIDNVVVFTSDKGVNFTKLVMELSLVCEIYGIDYVSLLR